MKKVLAFVLSLALLLCLCACGGNGGGNTLFEKASPSTSALRFVWFDGTSGSTGWIYNSTTEKEILDSLSDVKAIPAGNWTPELVTWPVYGISVGGFNADGVDAVWSNGYLIVADSGAYKFDYDFSKLQEGYRWEDTEEIDSIAYFPCHRWLAQNGDMWMAEYLAPAKEKTPPEHITMELTAIETERLTVTLTNHGDAEWMYGVSFSLEVLLDGVWYCVPYLPTPQNISFIDIAYILPAGEAREETYGLSFYGDLPSGTYRLVVEGLTTEFEI